MKFDETYMTINQFGCWEWEDSDTYWEYNPDSHEIRHCGKGQGCFWTDWEVWE